VKEHQNVEFVLRITDIRELEDLDHLLHGGIGWWEERGYDDIAETGRKLLREVECTLRELGRHE